MARDKDISRSRLINQLEDLRLRLMEFETLEIKHKKLENALRKSKERYRAIVESTPAMICRFLPDGTLSFVNSSYRDYFKKSEPELIGKNFFQFIPEEDQEKVRNHFLSLTIENPMVTYEHKVISPGGSICWQEWTDQALFDEEGHLQEYQSLGRDITGEKLAREEKSRLEKQLHQALKLEAIGTLAGGIAHDFNNILGIVIGFTELLLDDTAAGSQSEKNLKQIFKAADKGKELVKQILTFSRQIEHKKIPLRLGSIVEESLRFLRSTLPATIEIRKNIAKNQGIVLADPTQMQQVVINLGINAGQAMSGSGGLLEVKLENVYLEKKDFAGKDSAPGWYVKLSVADNGPGIPMKVQKRIFDPFFTTKEPGQGSGLGLSMVHGIVKEHGGDIVIRSKIGKGTTFHVLLPIFESEKASSPGIPAPLPAGNERILFVEDNEDLAEIGERILGNLGYHVETKTGSVAALEVFRRSPGKFDLIITDQAMPTMTGLQLTMKLRDIRKDIPVILCTGFSDRINEGNFKSHGINAFVLKPIAKKEIARLIRDVLDGK